MKRLETLRRQMEKVFVEGQVEALKLSPEMDKLIIAEQKAMLHQDGSIHIITQELHTKNKIEKEKSL